MSILSIMFFVLSLMFGFVFLIDCIRFRKEINVYVRYGIICGLILVGIDMSILLFVPDVFKAMPVYMLIVIDFVAIVRMAIFTCMGMYCCSMLKIESFPAVQYFRDRTEGRSLIDSRYLMLVGGTVALAVIYSFVLFKVTNPEISSVLKKLAEAQSARFGVGNRPSVLLALVVLEFAFGEEIVFRLGVQNYLARQFKLEGSKYWIAIFMSTTLWSLAHANTLDPEWVKIAQVFPLGLALGYLFRKYGTETCILVHGLFNVIMMFLGPYLITV